MRTPWLALILLSGCAAPLAPEAPDAAEVLSCAAEPCSAPVLAGAEPWISVDPEDPRKAVVAVMAGRRGGTYHPWINTAWTADGGRTWTVGQPEGGINEPQSMLGSYDFAADVMMARTRDAVVLAALVGRAAPPFTCAAAACTPGAPVFLNAIDLAVWRSEDGGATFRPAAIVARSEGAFVVAHCSPGPCQNPFPNRAIGAYPDREHLAADPVTGRLHLAWARVANDGTFLSASHSDDGGRTWSERRLVSNAYGYGPWVNALGGRVLMTYLGATDHELRTSLDGGATWSDPVALGPKTGYTTLPAAQWDEGRSAALLQPAGTAHERVVLHTTSDAGATWTQADVDAFAGPAERRLLAFDADPATGRGALATYVHADGPDALSLRVLSFDAGRLGPAALSPSTGTATRSAAFDYFGLDAAGGSVHATWGESAMGGITTVGALLAWAPPG